jgi:hypothetical protein
MNLADVITTIKDVLISVAAGTTAVVAVLGLQSWRRELTGHAEFEAARHLIKATYRLREEIANSRAPFVSAAEFPEDYPGPGEASAGEEARALSHIYRNRWIPIASALEELDSRALEAEALWGDKIKEKTDELRQCIVELRVAMDAIVDDKAQCGEIFKEDRDFGRQMRSKAHASRSDQDNQLSQRITVAIAGIEDQVRPHLRRS